MNPKRLLIAVFSLGFFHSSNAFSQEIPEPILFDSFVYLKSYGASTELERLREIALEEHSQSRRLVEGFMELFIVARRRSELQHYVWSVYAKNSCENSPKGLASRQLCSWLRETWNERLSDLLFYDLSASDFERARRALEAKDCREAQLALRDLESREGVFVGLLKLKKNLSLCLDDLEAGEALNDQIEKMRL